MNSKKSELESVGAKSVSFSDCAEVVPDISSAEDCSDGGGGSAPETEDAKEVDSSSSSAEVDSTSPTEQGEPESDPSPLNDVVDGSQSNLDSIRIRTLSSVSDSDEDDIGEGRDRLYSLSSELSYQPSPLMSPADRPYSMRTCRVGPGLSGEKFDICNVFPEVSSPLRRGSASTDSGGITPQTINPIKKPLKRLVNIVHELVHTEKSFVCDMQKLLTILKEWRYSTHTKVQSVVRSSAYVGVSTAVETINRTSALFLTQLQGSVEGQSEADTDDVLSMYSFLSPTCTDIFNSFILFSSIFPLFSEYFIHHDEFTIMFSSACKESSDFRNFVEGCEKILGGESTLSMVIKPVQRLPRYVMLCKEICDALEKCTLFDISQCESMTEDMMNDLENLFELSEEASKKICDCVHQCNELVQSHQDISRLHELHTLFVDGGTDVSANKIVVKGRRIIKEGDLRRHHKHGGIKTHRVQLFSDALFSSSPYGKGLRLEQNVDLMRHKDTMCYPIPAPGTGGTSTWFVVITNTKRLYFSASSSEDMMGWVRAIHEVLLANETDSDFYLLKHQVAIVNIMIAEINERKNEAEQSLDEGSSSASIRHRSVSSFSKAFTQYTNSIQASWWHLVDLLDSPFLSPESCSLLSLSRSNSVSLPEETSAIETQTHETTQSEERGQSGGSCTGNLLRVIEHHSKEVAHRILLSIECAEEDHIDGQHPVKVLLNDSALHYLIAVGVFFEYPGEYSGSMETGDRPLLLKLFLLNDVLIAAYIDKVNNHLQYAFHIRMAYLQCLDYRDGVGELAIVLADTTGKPLNRRRGSIFKTADSDSHSRLLYAPSIDMKFDWLSLMMQASEDFKASLSPLAPAEEEREGAKGPAPSPTAHLKSIPLQRLTPDVVSPAWTPRKYT